MPNIRKYDGHFVSAENISEALDDNGAYVVSGRFKLFLRAIEKDGEVLKQWFEITMDKMRILKVTDEEAAIKHFLEVI